MSASIPPVIPPKEPLNFGAASETRPESQLGTRNSPQSGPLFDSGQLETSLEGWIYSVHGAAMQLGWTRDGIGLLLARTNPIGRLGHGPLDDATKGRLISVLGAIRIATDSLGQAQDALSDLMVILRSDSGLAARNSQLATFQEPSCTE